MIYTNVTFSINLRLGVIWERKHRDTTSQKIFCNDSIINMHYSSVEIRVVTSILSPDNTFDKFLAIFCIRLWKFIQKSNKWSPKKKKHTSTTSYCNSYDASLRTSSLPPCFQQVFCRRLMPQVLSYFIIPYNCNPKYATNYQHCRI